jgi:Tfp pilus assembly protein PilV
MKVKGYSMIETLVALAIATMLVLGFHNLSGSLTKARNSNKLAQQALILAGNKMEELLANPGSLAVTPTGDFITDPISTPGFTVGYMIRSGTADAVVSGTDELARIYTVEVRVSYGTGEERLSTSFYIFRE